MQQMEIWWATEAIYCLLFNIFQRYNQKAPKHIVSHTVNENTLQHSIL